MYEYLFEIIFGGKRVKSMKGWVGHIEYDICPLDSIRQPAHNKHLSYMDSRGQYKQWRPMKVQL